MVTLQSIHGTITKTRADVLAYFTFEDPTILKKQLKRLRHSLPSCATALKSSAFKGKEFETLTLYPPEISAARVVLVGLGKREKLNRERLRRGAAVATKNAAAAKAKTVALLEPDAEFLEGATTDLDHALWENVATAIGEGAYLSLYRFDKYLTSDRADRNTVRRVILVCSDRGRVRLYAKGLRYATAVARATCLARDLANAPANEIYPESLSTQARKSGRRSGFKVRVLDQRAIRRLRMGGLLAVSQGSDRPPRFLIMEYRGRRATPAPVVLVGKGVTFDAGGISLKPSAGMAEMKMDMSGAGAVIGTLQAAAELRLPVHLIGLVPATENLPGGAAMKPGDIVLHHNGKTSEVDNTDAEGRLILADALSYASRYKPALVIDLATLTGACVVALGHYATGMMANDQSVADQLKAAGEHTYERVWQLPMYEEYEKLIKSDVADVKNVGGRWGGAITAAMFLRKFIGTYAWVHLDIAGTAMQEEAHEYIPKGGTGVGVRLLMDFLRHWHSQKPSSRGARK